jgi:TBC1 domain family member 2
MSETPSSSGWSGRISDNSSGIGSSIWSRLGLGSNTSAVPGGLSSKMVTSPPQKPSSSLDGDTLEDNYNDATLPKERTSPSGELAGKEIPESMYRNGLFERILSADNVDLKELRNIAWNGIPWKYRTRVWQLLLGYMPTNKARREAAMTKKRKEYADSITTYYDIPDIERSPEESDLLRQIIVDLHRTCPMVPLFHQPVVQKLMERILYIWSLRHPASGYVQGMNDLLTPLLLVSLHPFVQGDVIRADIAQIDDKSMLNVEADAFWSLTKLLDGIQDHYTQSQPGIQRMVLKLEDLVRRIEKDLDQHLSNEGIAYLQFAFRWMNCILLREMPLRAIIRLWDTYIAEDGTSGFETFHVYVCVVLLQTFKEQLLSGHFQEMMLFLQEMPTMEWGERDVEPVLSQAFILASLYEGAQSHLN